LRTQVAIVGAGPAGLVLSHLLARGGVESVVLEAHRRDYVEKRTRAGVLESGTVDLLVETGVGERLQREGLVHRGLELRFDKRRHRIPLSDLSGGRSITVYGQQEVVKDLIAARLAVGGAIYFEARASGVQGATSSKPTVSYEYQGKLESLAGDVVVGCDGSHGICRHAIPAEALTLYHKEYPFAWLGVLAAVAPSAEELIYAYHERGFALHSLRSPSISRLYLQCRPEDTLESWPEERIWTELHQRFEAGGWSLTEGPILEKSITLMRSSIVEPMRHGNLFLAGDAAHIVPPTGAKGLNLAVADARVLADALISRYRTGSTELLDQYSTSCLRRVWKAEYFAWWMTAMLHRFDDDGPFEHRLHLAQLEHVCGSIAASTMLAENYVGLTGS